MTEVTPNLPHLGNFCKYCFMGTLLVGAPCFFSVCLTNNHCVALTSKDSSFTCSFMLQAEAPFWRVIHSVCLQSGTGAGSGVRNHLDASERASWAWQARFADGSAVAIDCIAIEDEYGNTPAQRAELDWLLYNKPLEYAQLVLSGEMEHYLSLGCEQGRLED